MALTYAEHWNELRAWITDLPPLMAQRLVNRALRTIYSERPWSFLTAETVIHVPAGITSGTVRVTSGSPYVMPDPTAMTALINLTNPVITHRQFRVTGSGPIYSIRAFDIQPLDTGLGNLTATASSTRIDVPFVLRDSSYVGKTVYFPFAGAGSSTWQAVVQSVDTLAGQWVMDSTPTFTRILPSDSIYVATNGITLDRNYAEATQTSATYSVYQCYFHPPTDFLNWTSVVDRENQFSLQIGLGERRPDIWDPARLTVSLPQMICEHRAVPVDYWDATYEAGRPMFELWPHYQSDKNYPALYVRQGTDFVNATDRAPGIISDELIQSKARLLAYQWKMLQGQTGILDLRSAAQEARNDYNVALRQAVKLDNEWAERNIITWLRPGHYITGAAYRQAHDLPA